MKNKKGWIRIIEAVIAVLLITGVLLVVISTGYLGRQDISSKVYDAQVSVLRDIELNQKFRGLILALDVGDSQINWADFESNGLGDIVEKIEKDMPNYLDCEATVCKLEDLCYASNVLDENIYAQSVAITADLKKYNPLQLKMFCWEK